MLRARTRVLNCFCLLTRAAACCESAAVHGHSSWAAAVGSDGESEAVKRPLHECNDFRGAYPRHENVVSGITM